MSHPQSAQWSDYVRGVLDSQSTVPLREHLEQDCAKCRDQVAAFQSVRRVAETDLRIEPPVATVRAARNLFRIQKLVESAERPRVGLDLSFDSFQSPAASGVRRPSLGERHLVFEGPELVLDLELRSEGRNEPVRIHGQVLDAETNPLAEVPAFLLVEGRVSAQARSGKAGDFRLLCRAATASRLCLLVGECLVDIQLPSLLFSSA